MAISGLSRVRTELFELTVIQVLAPHPVQVNRQLSGHRYLRDLSSSAHAEVEELAAPVPLAAYRDLGRFDQQIAKQRVALFADVSESAAIAAGFFRRNQTHISWRFACRSESVREFQSPTRKLRPSADPRRDASSIAALRRFALPPIIRDKNRMR